MNEVNFQASVNNTVQMDRHQQDTARTPVVNQSQNAVIEQEEAEKRIQMPVQPDQVEGKKVDPRERKTDAHAKKKRQKKNGGDSSGRRGRTTTGGFFVDLQA
jgi:hypothetical protein